MHTSWVTTGHSFTASATSGADTYQLFVSAAPAPPIASNGSTFRHVITSVTLRENGATVGVETNDSYYYATSLDFAGAVYADGAYLLPTTSHSQPSTATVGSGGPLGTQTLYEDSTRTRVRSTQRGTWTLEPAASGSAYYCVNAVVSSPSGAVIGTSVLCYRISTSGNILGIRWTLAVSDLVLTFQ
jgi:hypothetical protein